MSKVLFFGNFNYEKGFASVQRTISIARLFANNGFEPIVFIESKTILTNKSITFEYIKSRNNFSKYFNHNFWINYLDKYSDIDFVVIYDFPSFISGSIVKHCRKKNIKVISDITEWFGKTSNNIILNFVKKIDTFLRIHFYAKKTDGIITVSSYLFNYFKSVKNRIVVYPIPFQSKKLNRTSGDYKEIRIGYFGNPGYRKDDIIKIVNLLSNVYKETKLIVAGNVPRTTLKKLSRLGYWNEHCEFLGSVPPNTVMELLLTCDYQIIYREKCRSNNAGFPSKVAESVVNGINIISSDISDISSVVDKNENIILENDLTNDIATLNKRLMKNKQRLSQSFDVFSIDFYGQLFSSFLKSIR